MLATHIVMADWPQPRKGVVLSVGAIPELLNLRAEVLRSAGYQVISTSAQNVELPIASGDCGALLLCHSIPDDWQTWSVNASSPARLARTLAAERERVLLFRTLATLHTDIPLLESVDVLRWQGPTPAFAPRPIVLQHY